MIHSEAHRLLYGVVKGSSSNVLKHIQQTDHLQVLDQSRAHHKG